MRYWTEREDNILRQYYKDEGTKVEQRLEGRSAAAIRLRAQQLDLYNRKPLYNWTEDEIEILKSFYPQEGKKVKYRLPGRTVKTIQVMAHRLNIKKNKR